MTDKELQKLNRRQLLELMLSQSKRIDKLERDLAEARAELENRRVTAEKAGSIAEAALQLSGIFEAAQEAADIYLDSIRQSVTPQQVADVYSGGVRQNAAQKKVTEFDFENWEF